MNLPAQYSILKILQQELLVKSEKNGYPLNEIKGIINQSTGLINELALAYPSEEMKTAQATVLTLLQKAQKQAESYSGNIAHPKKESESTPFMDVLQPAQEALDIFLHTGFPSKQEF
jgi:hypothetical protein